MKKKDIDFTGIMPPFIDDTAEHLWTKSKHDALA